jgi:hypothetical protein
MESKGIKKKVLMMACCGAMFLAGSAVNSFSAVTCSEGYVNRVGIKATADPSDNSRVVTLTCGDAEKGIDQVNFYIDESDGAADAWYATALTAIATGMVVDFQVVNKSPGALLMKIFITEQRL